MKLFKKLFTRKSETPSHWLLEKGQTRLASRFVCYDEAESLVNGKVGWVPWWEKDAQSNNRQGVWMQQVFEKDGTPKFIGKMHLPRALEIWKNEEGETVEIASVCDGIVEYLPTDEKKKKREWMRDFRKVFSFLYPHNPGAPKTCYACNRIGTLAVGNPVGAQWVCGSCRHEDCDLLDELMRPLKPLSNKRKVEIFKRLSVLAQKPVNEFRIMGDLGENYAIRNPEPIGDVHVSDPSTDKFPDWSKHNR